MGLFSGLEKFGLGKLEKMDVSKKKRKEMRSNIRKRIKSHRFKKKIYCLINHLLVRYVMRNFIQKWCVPVR